MNRRHFLQTAVLTGAAASLAGTNAAQAGPVRTGTGQTGEPELSSRTVRNFHPEMPYRRMGRTGVMVSALGFGMLRLPMLADGKTVDEQQTVDMLRYGIDNGINYVDTARGYLRGQSETAVGKALRNGYRDRVYLATKLNLGGMRDEGDFQRMFDESRRQLHTDVIDFYLMHHVTHRTWNGSVLPYKVLDKVQRCLEEDSIRYAGFSFHDNLAFFKQVLDAYPWDFCQLMENYLDTEYEAGYLGMKLAYERGLAVNCMEPLKAGFVVRPPQKVQDVFDAAQTRRTPIEWAFDYLWSMPEPGVVISGMSNIAQVKENISYARKARVGMLTWEDRMVLGEAARRYRDFEGVIACTGCNNCAPCPKLVAIGSLIGQMWYIYKVTGNRKAARAYYNNVPYPRGVNADACDGCGQCLPRCPMQVNIPAILAEMRRELKA